MLIAASTLIVVGIILGFVAIVATDGGLACIISIVAMTGGTLLLQAAQRREVATPITNESNTME